MVLRKNKIILFCFILFCVFLILGVWAGYNSMWRANNKIKTDIEIDPFISRDYIKDPEKVCKYEGIEAACNQLLVTLYRKNDSIIHPTKEDILYLSEIVNIIKQGGGRIVGQISDLAELQIEVELNDNLIKLKKQLEDSGYVQSVMFNMTAEFL